MRIFVAMLFWQYQLFLGSPKTLSLLLGFAIDPKIQIMAYIFINFQNVFTSLAGHSFCSFLFLFFLFILRPAGMLRSTNFRNFIFLLNKINSDILVGIKWSVCTSESQRILGISFYWIHSGLWTYLLSLYSHFGLQNSQWMTFPTQASFFIVWHSTAFTYQVYSSRT